MLASALLFLLPAAYQALAVIAALRHLSTRHPNAPSTPVDAFSPGISVLKPLRGLDPNTRAAFRSQLAQTSTQFEVLFGVREESDPAVAEIKLLQQEFPDAAIRLHIGGPDTPNNKVGLLIHLSRHAQYPIWVVNDSDIVVPPEYLATITQPLTDPDIGVVTCLYRARAHTAPAAWESLGIATDFMPSTLVAQLIGVREFGLGSTLAFRAADLQQAGGFESLAEFLADDYQLSKRITSLGKRTLLSQIAVETSLGEATWSGIWNHQLRWARTIRACKGAGYSGVFITHAGVWLLLLLARRSWGLALALYVLRLLSAAMTTRLILRDRPVQKLLWLAPLWDHYAFAIWVAAHWGRTVRWRGRSLRIDSEGRIL